MTVDQLPETVQAALQEFMRTIRLSRRLTEAVATEIDAAMSIADLEKRLDDLVVMAGSDVRVLDTAVLHAVKTAK